MDGHKGIGKTIADSLSPIINFIRMCVLSEHARDYTYIK